MGAVGCIAMATRSQTSSSHPSAPLKDPHGKHWRFTWEEAIHERDGEHKWMPGVRAVLLSVVRKGLQKKSPTVIVAECVEESAMGLQPDRFWSEQELDESIPFLYKIIGPGVLVEVKGGEGDAPRVIAAWSMWEAWSRNGEHCAGEDVLKVCPFAHSAPRPFCLD